MQWKLGSFRTKNAMSASLKGKSVIVTGGSKGIGEGMARVFAGHGAKVLIVARHLKDAEAATQELSNGGATVGAFAADVTKLSDMEAMAKAAVDRHGGLDVLCANAGIFQGLGEEYLRAMAASIPLKRLGTVDDIGHAAAFLASRKAPISPARPSSSMEGKSSRNRWRRWPPPNVS